MFVAICGRPGSTQGGEGGGGGEDMLDTLVAVY